jgi:hypothetical protein
MAERSGTVVLDTRTRNVFGLSSLQNGRCSRIITGLPRANWRHSRGRASASPGATQLRRFFCRSKIQPTERAEMRFKFKKERNGKTSEDCAT